MANEKRVGRIWDMSRENEQVSRQEFLLAVDIFNGLKGYQKKYFTKFAESISFDDPEQTIQMMESDGPNLEKFYQILGQNKDIARAAIYYTIAREKTKRAKDGEEPLTSKQINSLFARVAESQLEINAPAADLVNNLAKIAQSIADNTAYLNQIDSITDGRIILSNSNE